MEFGLENIDIVFSVSLTPLALLFVNSSLFVTSFALIHFCFLKPHQARLYEETQHLFLFCTRFTPPFVILF